MLEREPLPQHIGFIMDGNRRWATSRDLSLIEGHRAGMKAIKPIVKRAAEIGIPNTTFWAFSTENKFRPPEQVHDLLTIFDEGLDSDIVDELLGDGAQLDVIGDLKFFPGKLVRKIELLKERSKENAGIRVTMALNYGGEDEMVAGVNALIRDGHKQVDRKLLRQYLFAPDQPDMDLVIRTGGEVRTSGFAPIKAAYAEWYFDDTLWPDFTSAQFDLALDQFQSRKRNFGH